MAANSAMVILYWDIGRLILERQEREGWGAKVIDRLSADLREAFPDMSGLSPRNLKYMRAFAAAWPDAAIVQRGSLHKFLGITISPSWRSCEAPDDRLWYADKALEHGWSHNILGSRSNPASTNARARPSPTSPPPCRPPIPTWRPKSLKTPTSSTSSAPPIRAASGKSSRPSWTTSSASCSNSAPASPSSGGRSTWNLPAPTIYLDLLFYHLKLRCYVVVELKAVPFDPGFVGTMNMYLSAVDDLLRHPDDKPSIGLLLCRSKNKLVVEYALRGFKKPIGVAEWETEIVKKLPEELKGSLPTVEEIEAELMGADERKWCEVSRLQALRDIQSAPCQL